MGPTSNGAADLSDGCCDNAAINTIAEASLAAQIAADNKAVMENVLSGTPLDPEIARRVDERADQITERLRRQHGTLNIAVDLVREARDAE